MNSEPDEPALFDLPLAPPGMHDSGAPEGGEAASRRARPCALSEEMRISSMSFCAWAKCRSRFATREDSRSTSR